MKEREEATEEEEDVKKKLKEEVVVKRRRRWPRNHWFGAMAFAITMVKATVCLPSTFFHF